MNRVWLLSIGLTKAMEIRADADGTTDSDLTGTLIGGATWSSPTTESAWFSVNEILSSEEDGKLDLSKDQLSTKGVNYEQLTSEPCRCKCRRLMREGISRVQPHLISRFRSPFRGPSSRASTNRQRQPYRRRQPSTHWKSLGPSILERP